MPLLFPFCLLSYLSYQPGAILDCIDDVDTLDKVASRTFGLDTENGNGGNVMVNAGLLGISPDRMMVAKIEPSGD
ncbi:MAG TPA: hypothetical protein VMQ39_03250 [Candidatus Dormibacteraeota bacterium]|nr:hypothetical protein [Candidatus Dormibacteraeota bacterium]